MTILGPVYNATHGVRGNPWFSMLIGVVVLVTAWTNYLRGDLVQRRHFGVLLGISAICGFFIALGIWELLH
jgi:hypothetical protein